jgi:hypothetical protein
MMDDSKRRDMEKRLRDQAQMTDIVDRAHEEYQAMRAKAVGLPDAKTLRRKRKDTHPPQPENELERLRHALELIAWNGGYDAEAIAREALRGGG